MNVTAVIGLTISIVLILMLFLFLDKTKTKSQLKPAFMFIIICLLICCSGQLIQLATYKLNIPPIYFDYFVYIGTCYLPVAFLLMALIFAKTKINFNWKYKSLFIIPTLSIILLWTNNYHHLFYKVYSTNINETIYGTYFNTIHSYYSIIFYIIAFTILIRYSIKNSGFFSKQATLIVLGSLVPIITNALGIFGIISMSIYITPITFSFTIFCLALAIFKVDFLKVTPIALQRIVDRISDSYIVLNENNLVSDFNQTFMNTFHIRATEKIRGENTEKILKKLQLNSKEFNKNIEKIKKDYSKTANFEIFSSKAKKYFHVEITALIVNNNFAGILILFKDITQHINDMQNLKDNQTVLMEQERLASLGQMIGGIAHNLKTPIFSVSGGLEGLSDLIKEYDESIDDDSVTNQDMHDIAKDMNDWILKLKDHVEYMSDVITTVKGQAVSMSEDQKILFPVSELFQHVNILMQHEVKEKLAELEIINKVPDNIKINGNINSLVQVINNLILNAIEAYDDAPKKKVELIASTNKKDIIISVKDYGPGLPDNVKQKLFKEMITTKGKNGTGLGLFMSNSNIKAHFNGQITFETAKNRGTTFNVIIPIT